VVISLYHFTLETQSSYPGVKAPLFGRDIPLKTTFTHPKSLPAAAAAATGSLFGLLDK